MKEYYVYEWFIKETGEVFYVGKGKKNRYKIKGKRNKLFEEIASSNDCDCRFVFEGLEDDEAYEKERDTITYYKEIGWCRANYSDGGRFPIVLIGEKNAMFGKTHSEENRRKMSLALIGKQAGEKNPMFGVSPKERMSPEKYSDWKRKQQENKVGEKNPNYGNRKLSTFYKEHPDVALEKQSRKDDKNGKAKIVYLYDENFNLINKFSCIKFCAKYMIDLGIMVADISDIANKIGRLAKNKEKFLSFYFSFTEL